MQYEFLAIVHLISYPNQTKDIGEYVDYSFSVTVCNAVFKKMIPYRGTRYGVF
jgi:hypothetical protein